MNIILFSEFFGKKVILPDYYMIEFFAMYMELINTGLIQLQLFSNENFFLFRELFRTYLNIYQGGF